MKSKDIFKLISGQRRSIFVESGKQCQEMHCKRGDIQLGPEETNLLRKKDIPKGEYIQMKIQRSFQGTVN